MKRAKRPIKRVCVGGSARRLARVRVADVLFTLHCIIQWANAIKLSCVAVRRVRDCRRKRRIARVRPFSYCSCAVVARCGACRLVRSWWYRVVNWCLAASDSSAGAPRLRGVAYVATAAAAADKCVPRYGERDREAETGEPTVRDLHASLSISQRLHYNYSDSTITATITTVLLLHLVNYYYTGK